MPYKDPVQRSEYHKQYMKNWYQENKSKHIGYQKNRKNKYRETMASLKMHPCMDCGFAPEFPEQMDWDHRENKTIGISVARAKAWGWDRIKEEIAKCDLVCANCHRKRTVLRRKGSLVGTTVS